MEGPDLAGMVGHTAVGVRHGLHGAIRPVPVRQNVRHRKIETPVRLVDIEAVLGEAGEVNDAEIRAARGVVAVAIRRRLAEIIEAGPDKLARDKWGSLLAGEFGVRRVRPSRGVKVVGTDLNIGAARALVVADGEEVFTAGADARGGFTAENRLVGIGRVETAISRRLVIVAEHVLAGLETVEPGDRVVIRRGRRARRP